MERDLGDEGRLETQGDRDRETGGLRERQRQTQRGTER